MKFYFCQACGVRVTEDDIDEGLARNKKLKGVYCSQCAVGVTTMEEMPLSEEKARELLQQGEGAAKAGASGATKFYFCEKCGTRLDEPDIEAGKARDKKLKGIYCRGCAEGVMTIEYDGMTREDAERIVSQARARRRSSGAVQIDPVATRRKDRRGSSRLRMAAAEGGGGRIPEPSAPSSSKGLGLAAGIGVGVGAAALLLFLFLGGEKPSSNRKTAKKKPAAAKETDSKTATTEVVRQPQPAPKNAQPRTQQPGKTEDDWGSLQAELARHPDDISARIGVIEAFLEKNAVHPKVAAANQMLADLKSKLKPETAAAGTTDGPATADPEAPDVASPPPEPDDKETAGAKAPPMAARKIGSDEILAWMTRQTSLDELQARLAGVSDEELDEEARKRIGGFRTLVVHALETDTSLKEYLKGQVGKRILLAVPGMGKRFFDIHSLSEGQVTMKGYGGLKPLPWSYFSLSSVRTFLGGQLGKGSEANAKAIAWLLLRGNASHGGACLKRLPDSMRGPFEIIWTKLEREVREKEARAALETFRELQRDKKWRKAIEAGRALAKTFGSTDTVASLKPSLETRIADLVSISTGLKGLFWGPVKRLPNNLVQIEINPENMDQWAMDLFWGGLAGRFVEIQAELRNKRMLFMYAGDSIVSHPPDSLWTLIHNGQKYPLGRPRKSGEFLKLLFWAGPGGARAQLEDGPVTTMKGPWKGGQIHWRNSTILNVKGRLDPLWVQEMQSVVLQRQLFERGQWVALKPTVTERPWQEVEWRPFSHFKQTEVTRSLAEWHTCGPDWKAEGDEWVSPQTATTVDSEITISSIQPMALGQGNVEMYFEAKIEEGDFAIHCGNLRDGIGSQSWFVFGVDKMGIAHQNRLRRDKTFPGFVNWAHPDTRAWPAERTPCKGKWVRYMVTKTGQTLKVKADGAKEYSRKTRRAFILNLTTLTSAKVRIRNVRLRKIP